MPQENFPFTIITTDSTYTINAPGDLENLPDSLKAFVQLPGAGNKVVFTEEELRKMNEPSYQVSPLFMMGALVIFAIAIYKSIQARAQEEKDIAAESEAAGAYIPQCLVYKGAELKFTGEEIHAVCSRYNPFYNKLNERKQNVFINRLQQFMCKKDFYIMSPEAYKEMPILVSATAIQISYGLDEYLFPYFTHIIIHPEEYIAWDPLRVLVGNVQGRSIALSWKHFLEDYKNPTDGKNVGLHEMAHALQVQHLFKNYGYNSNFREDYEHYDKIDDEVLLAEKTNSSTLFDENALRNPDEFWATCVELFFEKPLQLQAWYPHLYKSICMVLNQDTAAM